MIGTSYKEADIADGERQAQKAKGQKILSSKDRNTTFNDLVDWFEKQPAKKELKYYKVLIMNLNSWCKEYGDYCIYNLTALDVRNYRVKRQQEGLSAATIDHHVGAIRNVLGVAWEGEKVTGEALFPFKKVRKMLRRGDNTRTRVISFEELDLILKGLPVHARNITLTAFHTGMRRGEIVNLTWDRVDLKKMTINLKAEHTKTGRGRVVPINEELAGILAKIPRHIYLEDG
jgi:integrase